MKRAQVTPAAERSCQGGTHHGEGAVGPLAGTRMALLCSHGSLYTGLEPQLCLHTAGHAQHFPAVLVT